MSLLNAINNVINNANNKANNVVNYVIIYVIKKLFALLSSNLNKELCLPYLRPSYWLPLERDTPHSQVRPISLNKY